MPLAPDVEHFLLSSESLCHLGIDVSYYFRYVAPDANAYVDGYSPEGRSFARRKHLDTLRDMALYCEEGFLSWRAANRDTAVAASHMVYESMSEQISGFVSELSTQLVNRGHRHLDARGLGQSHREFGTEDCLRVLKRSATRSFHDLHGYDPARIAESRDLNDRLFQAYLTDDALGLASMRREMGVEEILIQDARKEQQAARLRARRRASRDRRVAKRSVRMAERFMGPANVRMFVGGDAIRLKGAEGVYEIARSGSLLQSHGGATLSVYDADGITFLCRLCIYTDKVPMLDHVMSLIFHIKAGSESDILSAGNAYEVAEAAYDRPWLSPHLPPREGDMALPSPVGPGLPEAWRGPDRAVRLVVLRREIARFVLDYLAPVLPPMPQTEAFLLSGMPESAFYREIAPRLFPGEVPERVTTLPPIASGSPRTRMPATIDL